MSMRESTRHYDLLQAFAEPRCPICAMVLRDLQKDMDTLLLERINNVPTHLAFRAGRGLCNGHAHRLIQAKGGALGIAVMYESTMVELMKDVSKAANSSGGGFLRGGSAGTKAADTLEPTGACLMCDAMTKNENFYVNIISENVRDSELQPAFADSTGGVCLPHGRLVLRQLSSKDDVNAFMALQQPKWAELQTHLQKYIEQNDNNVPQHKMGVERDSWSRAIRYLSGDEGVFGYRR
ncbi:MAG: DUF6062 family protein [Chloroflexota bacterium]